MPKDNGLSVPNKRPARVSLVRIIIAVTLLLWLSHLAQEQVRGPIRENNALYAQTDTLWRDLAGVESLISYFYSETETPPPMSIEPFGNAFGSVATVGTESYEQISFLSNLASPDSIEGAPEFIRTYERMYDKFLALRDVASPIEGAPWCYWTPIADNVDHASESWAIWGAGPDRDYDLSATKVALLFEELLANEKDALIELSYDPTNGVVSDGDVWAFKVFGELHIQDPRATPPIR